MGIMEEKLIIEGGMKGKGKQVRENAIQRSERDGYLI